MNYAYKRAMEHLHLSPQAREKITAGMEHARPFPRRRRHSIGRPAVLAAVLAAVLTVTALAAGAQLVFFHRVPEDVAETLQPVGRSMTSFNGITLTVQSAGVADGRFCAYVTMKDEQGDRLNEDMVDMLGLTVYNQVLEPKWQVEWRDMLLSGYPGGYPGEYNMGIETGPINYDEESGTYGFLLEVYDRDGRDIDFASGEFRLEVFNAYAGRKYDKASLPLAWPDVSEETATAHVDISRRWKKHSYSTTYQEMPLTACVYAEHTYIEYEDGADLLVPGESMLEIVEDYDVSATGWLDGKLHIQTRTPGQRGTTDLSWYSLPAGRLFLIRPDGSQVEPELLFYFWSEDNADYYEEYVYDISPEELEGCTLDGDYSYGGELIRGYWCVDFSLDEAETK